MVFADAISVPQQFLFMAELAQFLHGILWQDSVAVRPDTTSMGLSRYYVIGACR